MKNLTGIEKWRTNGKIEPYMSASKICLFKNDLPMFICKYGFGKSGSGSVAMQRGLIVEDAVVKVLTKEMSVNEGVLYAIDEFNKKYFVNDEEVAREYKNLEPMVRLSCEALADYGVPMFPENGKQERIEFNMVDKINGWEVPFIGFLDLVFPDKGVIVDLKTTSRIPSVQSFDHQLQRAIYAKAKGNQKVEFLYVNSSRYDFKEDGDVNEMLERARIIVNQMNSFCDNLTPEQARQSVPLNDGAMNFYWKGEHELKNFYNNGK